MVAVTSKKQPTCPFPGEWLNKIWNMHKIKYDAESEAKS